LKLVTCLLAALALLGPTACSATVPGAPAPTTAPTAGPGTALPPRPAFGPYLDTSMPIPDLQTLAATTGLKHVVLSFALAKDNTCTPAWDDGEAIESLRGTIDAFRTVGGSVTIATGGAEGTYLEIACTTAADLAGAYTKILDASGTNLLDIDVEHDVQIDKVIDALGQVQRARGTDITLTLPVDLEGLGPGQLNLVKKAAAANVAIRVNIMNMNFEASGDRGKALVRAARAMLAQLRKVYPNATAAEQNRMLSITLMIGRNDTGEITRAADVQTVLDFAKANGVGRVGFWSLGRDRGTCPGQVEAQPDCSGIAQTDYQFTKQFAGFTGPTPD
jgi:chitinase